MRVWDVRRAIQALRAISPSPDPSPERGGELADVPLGLVAEREMASIALYAALFESNIEELHLYGLAESHRDGPDFLNVLRYLDVPQAVAIAAEKSRVRIYQVDVNGWEYPTAVADRLGWDDAIETIETHSGAGR
jgi:hypothetical protein